MGWQLIIAQETNKIFILLKYRLAASFDKGY